MDVITNYYINGRPEYIVRWEWIFVDGLTIWWVDADKSYINEILNLMF